MAQENEALQALIGRQVQVESLSATSRYMDDGTLEAYDHPWVRLRKAGGEVICFPIYHIRLVKSV